MSDPLFVVRATGTELYLLQDRRWDETTRRAVTTCNWVRGAEHGTTFRTEADAWAAFDNSGCGRRSEYAVETLPK